MNKLIFIRHGENVANITKEFSYKIVDYSLTDKGRMQAKQTAEKLKETQIDELWSSPLKRAQETASYIADIKNMNIKILEGLREVNVGSLELKKPDEESWNVYLGVYDKWKSGDLDHKFPDGESYNEMRQRFKEALIEIFKDKNDKTIVVVGHGGIFSTTIWTFLEGDAKKPFKVENNNCSISEFQIEIKNDDVICNMIKFGDFSHLSGVAAEIVSGYPDFIKKRS